MLLDPRFKLSLISKDKEKVELVTQVKENVQSYMKEVEGPQEPKIRRIEQSSARVEATTSRAGLFSVICEEIHGTSNCEIVVEKDELEEYLSCTCMPFAKDYNALDFWKANCVKLCEGKL